MQWTTVAQLETGRNAHAVLSIGSEALPCLQGCLGQDDLFVGSLSSLSKEFSSSSSCLSGLSYLWRFYKADDHDHLIINCLWEWWRPLANILLWQFPFLIKQNLIQQQQQQTSQLKVVSVKHKQNEKLTKEGCMNVSYTKWIMFIFMPALLWLGATETTTSSDQETTEPNSKGKY